MTVETTKNKFTLSGDGLTKTFPFTGLPLNNPDSDLEVYIIESDETKVLQTINVDYTLNYNRDTISGEAVFVVTPTSLQKVFGIRNTDFKQGYDIPIADDFDARRIETSLDKIHMRSIDGEDRFNRSIKVDETFTGNVTLTGTIKAGSALVVNDTLDGFAYSVTNINDIDSSITEAENAAASATASANSASASSVSAAQQVTLAEAQVVLANNEADRSETEADRAETAASSTNLPTTITADTYLKSNTGATEYEAKTVAQVKTDLGIDTLTSAVALNTVKGDEVELFSGSAGISTIILSDSISNYRDIEFKASTTNASLINKITVSEFKTTSSSDGLLINGSSATISANILFHYVNDTTITITVSTGYTLRKVKGIK